MLCSLINSPQQAAAEECGPALDKINLLFDFEWSESSISALAKQLSLQCGEPENYARLMHAIKLYLINDGFDVATISFSEKKIDGIPQIQIESAAPASIVICTP